MNGAEVLANSLTAEISPASAEAFRKYLALMREGVMPDLRRIQAMGMQPAQLLDGGKTAMLVEAVPHQMLIETLRIRWGVAPLPRFAGKIAAVLPERKRRTFDQQLHGAIRRQPGPF